MKLTQEKRQVQSSVSNSQSFSIKTSSKAFAILSDLYEDKIFAIMRELGTNAYDAHMVVGKGDQPFGVHLPTALEPWFAIRDYGPSMSDDEVMTLYTTYFDSSKTESNDFVGALGLGSKSPFSYVDNFTVEAIQDGTKRTYMAYISDENTPTISRISEADTNEYDGLRIQFAVPERDHGWFSRKSSEVYFAFRTKPTFNTDIRFQTLYEQFEAENGLEVELDNGVIARFVKGIDSAGVIQGNIFYPLSAHKLDEEWDEDEENFVNQIFRYSYHSRGRVVFEMPIGMVDFTPSREALSYNKITKRNIVAAIRQLREKYREHVLNEARKKDSIFSALSIYETHVFGSTKKEGEDFLQEMVDKFDHKGDWEVNDEGFFVSFRLLLKGEVTYLEYKDIGKRTFRWVVQSSTQRSFRLGPLADLRSGGFIHIDASKSDVEKQKIAYRLKRHIKSEKGELYSNSTYAVYWDQETIDILEITTDRDYDEALHNIKHLRESKGRSHSVSGTKRKEVPAYEILYSHDSEIEGNSLTFSEFTEWLDEDQGEIMLLVRRKERSQWVPDRYDFYGLSNSIYTFQIDDALRTLKSAGDRMKITVVAVEKAESKKVRFEKIATKINPIEVSELKRKARAMVVIWKAQNEEIRSLMQSSAVVDTFGRYKKEVSQYLEAFVSKYGTNRLSKNSPIHYFLSLNVVSNYEAASAISTYQNNRILNDIFMSQEGVLEWGEAVNKFHNEYPLLDGIQNNMEHAMWYMKAVEIERKKAEKEIANQQHVA